MGKNYSAQIARTLVSHFESQGYKYEFDADSGLLRTKFNIKSKLSKVSFILDVKDHHYISYCSISMKADEDSRQNVMEYLTRANYGLVFGNFEFDIRDGEIRYKCTVDVDHTTLTSQMIERSLDVPILMFQRYGDEMLKVMFGMQTPARAIEIAEA